MFQSLAHDETDVTEGASQPVIISEKSTTQIVQIKGRMKAVSNKRTAKHSSVCTYAECVCKYLRMYLNIHRAPFRN